MNFLSKPIVIFAFMGALSFAVPANAHVLEEEQTKTEAQDKQPMARLVVNGFGKSYQAPDTAHVSAGVIATGVTAEAAMKDNAVKMEAAIQALLQAGVKRKHIQTSGLNLRPVYNRNTHGYGIPVAGGETQEPPKIISYQVHNMVTAKTYDMDNVGVMLDSLVKAGSNNINNVRFSLKDDTVAKAEARTIAMKDARAKAKTMAEGAGVSLGRILQISEGASYNQSYSDEIIVAAQSASTYSASTPIQSGQQIINASINMVFEIIQ